MSGGDVVIRAHGLGKCFRLGEVGFADYRGMHDLLERLARAPFRRRDSGGEAVRRAAPAGRAAEAAQGGGELWALRDVSFEVGRGEVLGIVGGNGAGKSVLLKILARVTKPTEGHARIRGRIGSMLEAGVGFHPELTGRENIYMSGAVLGMKKAEITRRFDEIVDFSGTGRHLDTPIKRFSSGMQVRLAFAVAAHLDPGVLIVDEVLAVGDEAFVNRCARRLEALAAEGRTILLVSHDMQLIERLCTRGLLLRAGRVVLDGPTADVVRRYHEEDGA